MTENVAASISTTTKRFHIGSLAQAGLVGAVLAFIGNLLILYMGRAFGTPFEVMAPFSEAFEPLNAVVLIGASLPPAIFAALLLWLLPMWTEKPLLIFWVVAAIVFYYTLNDPNAANVDSPSTASGLNLMHAWTALAIVAAISALTRPATE